MARTPENDLGGTDSGNAPEIIQADGQSVITLPDADFVTNADILREGQDLVLEAPDGSVIVIEGYFNAYPAPLLQAESGQTLTPQLVESFVQQAGPLQYAQAGTLNDESPVGAVQEVSGQSTVTHADGSTETITIGTPIYEGDVIETSEDGAVNITFVDETTFAVSQSAKLAIDEYVFDPASESGSSDFSVLRGLFVFTSGLIGRDDPDDVTIDTPMGSIGIRGTTIVGNTDTGEITVMEGAIVMRGFDGSELTMTDQFDTGRFDPATGEVTYLGRASTDSFSNSYDSLKPVSPDLFSGLDDNAADSSGDSTGDNTESGAESQNTEPDSTTQPTTEDAPAEDAATDTTDETAIAVATTDETAPTEETAATTEEAVPAEEAVVTDTTATDTTATDSTFVDTTTSFDGSADSTFDTTTDTSATTTGSTTTTTSTTSTTSSSTSSSSTTDTTTTDTTPTDTTTPPPPPSVLAGSPPVGVGNNVVNLVAPQAPVFFSNDSIATFNVANNFSDVDGGGLSLSISDVKLDGTSLGNPGWITMSGGTITFDIPDNFLAVAGADAILNIFVTATDPEGNKGTAAFTVNLLAPDVLGTTGSNGALNNGTTSGVTVGLDGDDTINVTAGGGGASFSDPAVVFGGMGNDTINIVATESDVVVYGGAGDDTITSNGTFNDIFGGLGIDTITIASGALDNFVSGGANNDIITIQSANINFTNNLVNSGIGDDIVTIDSGATYNKIDTFTGNDTIIIDGATTSNNEILAYDGADTITIRNSATFNSIEGEGGDDVFNIESGANTNMIHGDDVLGIYIGNDIFNINGSGGNNTLVGGRGNDIFNILGSSFGNGDDFQGGLGNDQVNASTYGAALTFDVGAGTINDAGNIASISGIEKFIGGAGISTFISSDGDGNQTYVSGNTSDSYNASAVASNVTFSFTGTDVIATHLGSSDTLVNVGNLNGGTAVNTLDFSGNGGGSVSITGFVIGDDGAGNSFDAFSIDTIIGSSNADTITGNSADNFSLGGGNDVFVAGLADGNDTIGAGAGTDTYDGSAVTAAMTFDLTNIGNEVTGGAGTDSVSNVEIFKGGTANDIFTGDAGNNSFYGNAGNDTFFGSGGGDLLDGGTGLDKVDYSASSAAVNIDLGAGTNSGGDAAGDTLTSIEDITGSAFNDTLRGDNAVNIIDGGAGNDILQGSGGVDTLDGGAGIDKVDYSMFGFANNITSLILNSSGSTTITSAGGNDTLTSIENIIGTQGDDNIDGRADAASNIIYGGLGDDTLGGSTGDTLKGEGGNDILVVSSDTGLDIDGGISGTGDILRFGSAGVHDTANFTNITSIEKIDTIGAGGGIALTVGITNSMLTSSETGSLVINIDDGSGDVLTVDFGVYGGSGIFSLFSGDLSGGGQAIYDNSSTGAQITVNYTGGGGSISIIGAIGGIVGLDLNTLGGADGFKITDDIGEGFGYSIAALGDLNNDGFDDIAFTKQTNAPSVGRVFVLNGQAADYASGTLPGFAPAVDSGLLTASTNDLQIAAGGDFNGDGILDYIVGASNADSTNAGSGNIQIIDGNTGNVLLTLDGMTTGDLTGQSIDFIGDVNNDGYDDVIIGAPGSDTNGTNSGSAYVLFGDNYNPGGGAIIDVTAIGTAAPAQTNAIGIGTGATDNDILHTGGSSLMATVSVSVFNVLKIFDMSNPEAPVLAGTSSSLIMATSSVTLAHDMNTGKNYAFVTNGSQLDIFDLSGISTAAPPTISPTTIISGIGTGIIGVDVDFIADIAVTISGDGKISVIDLNGGVGTASLMTGSPLANAALANATEIILNGGYAYVANGSGIQVVDVTAPTAPSIGTADALANITDIYMHDGLLVAVANNGSTSDLVLYDLVDPSDPAVIPGGTINFSGSVMDVFVEHDTAIMVVDNGADASIVMVDISNPASPVMIKTITGVAFADVQAVVAMDGFAYVLDLSNANNLQTFDLEPDAMIIDGLATGDLLGAEVSSAGDFNDDGFEDFMISMPGTDSVALVLGGESMLNFDITDNTTFIEITGISDTDNEIQVMNMGDLNGDGINDIAVVSDGGVNEKIQIFFGNNLYNPATSLSTASTDMTITAAAGFEIVGGGAVGDFNGDGFDDFAVAMRDTGGAGDMVSIYVVYGGGLTMLDNSIAGVGLNDSANAFLMTYQIPTGGANVVTNFDFEITSSGDLNGDGFADMVIGMPNLDTDADGDQDGETMFVYGRDTDGTIVTDNDGTDFDPVAGTVLANGTGWSLVGTSGIDILIDGDQIGISMSAGAGNDTIVVNNDQFQNIDGGGGFDTLRLTDSINWALDLSNVGSEKFQNIEHIDMLDGNAQTVVLGMDDIFDMMQSSSNDTAKIEGNANDIFVIEMPSFDFGSGILFDNNFGTFNAGEGDLFDFGTRTAEGGGFSSFTFESGGYQLWISDAIINNGSVVIGSNIVLDGDGNDANGTAGDIKAGANEQTLVGDNTINIMDDNGMFDASMFGMGGNDIFDINNGDFDILNGGAGMDTLNLNGSMDIRGFNGHDISSIETMVVSSGGAGVLTLDMNLLIEMMESSNDTQTLTIDQIVAGDQLQIDVMGTGTSFALTATGGSGNSFYDETGATGYAVNGSYQQFTYAGGLTLNIESTFFTGTDIGTI